MPVPGWLRVRGHARIILPVALIFLGSCMLQYAHHNQTPDLDRDPTKNESPVSSQVNPVSVSPSPLSGESSQKLSQTSETGSRTPKVRKSESALDSFIDANGGGALKESYYQIKSMFSLWNPEASRWATKSSRRYRTLLKKSEPISDPVRPDEPWVRRNSSVEPCNCTRTIWSRAGSSEESQSSTCSSHAAHRGPGQRVVGFSFYGNPKSKLAKSRQYFQGIAKNLADLPHFYPNWTLRLYYDLEPQHPLMPELCSLACQNEHLDLCHVRHIPAQGDISLVFAMIWRFYPVIDPQVTWYVSRDLDSRFSAREKAAVDEWAQSPSAFHFMRDHPAHGIEILGSGWGVHLGGLERLMMSDAFEQARTDSLFWSPRRDYGPDQGFLKRYLWPWAKWNALTHDSYTCLQFPRTSPFPTERRMEPHNFIAAVAGSQDVLRQACPRKCRPPTHPEWQYC